MPRTKMKCLNFPKGLNARNLFLSLIYFVSLVILIMEYRMGSARIDQGRIPGLRDLATYIPAGDAIWNGNNPYIDPYVRVGPSIIMFIGLLHRWFTAEQLAYLTQISIPIGIMLFAGKLNEMKWKTSIPIIICITWISSSRENLVNIQLTGFICLFFWCGSTLLEKGYDSLNRSLIFVGLLFIVISIDSKPHLLGLYAFVYILTKFGVKYFLGFLVIEGAIHGIASILIGNLITLEWASVLLGLHRLKIQGSLGESVAIWPILERAGLENTFTTKLALVTVFLFAIVFMFRAVKEKNVTRYQEILLLIPSFGFFFHYYDLAIIASVVLLRSLREDIGILNLGVLFCFIVPENFHSYSNIVLIIVLGSFRLAVLDIPKSKQLRILIGAFFIWSIYASFLSIILADQNRHSWAMTFDIIILFLMSLKKTFREKSSL